MYSKQKSNQIFSLFEEIKPRKHSTKKPIPSFNSKFQPLFQSKLKKTLTKNISNSNSLIMFDNQDKSTIDKIISINYRNKKPKNQNSLSTSSSNFLLFQKSISNTNKNQISNHNSGTGKLGLQVTNQNFVSSTLKSQNPSMNNSIVFTPFNKSKSNTKQNTANHKTNSSKNKKVKTTSNSVSHDNKKDSFISDNKIDLLLHKLNKQLKECPKDDDNNKFIDKKFSIIKQSYLDYVKMLPNDKHKNYLFNIMEMITMILQIKNDQISELTTNSSLDNHFHPYNKKKLPLNQIYTKQATKLHKKNSKDKNIMSQTLNILSKKEVYSDDYEENETSERNNGISTTKEMEQLQEIQFCDKVKLLKHNSMPNLNIPKLDFNFIYDYYGNSQAHQLYCCKPKNEIKNLILDKTNLQVNSFQYDPEQITIPTIKKHKTLIQTNELTDDSKINHKTTTTDDNNNNNERSNTFSDKQTILLKNKILKSINSNNKLKQSPNEPQISIGLVSNVSMKQQSPKSLNISSKVKNQTDQNIPSFSSSLSSIEFICSISQSKFSSKIINSQVITDDVNERYPNLLIEEIEGKCLNGNKLTITPAGLKNSPRYYGDGFVFFGRKLFDITNKYIINDVILVNPPTFHPLYKLDNHFFVIFFNNNKRTYFIRTFSEQNGRESHSNESNSFEPSHDFTLNFFMVKIVSPYILSRKEFIVVNDKVLFVEINTINSEENQFIKEHNILNIILIPQHNKKTEMKSYVFSSKDKQRVIIGRDRNCDIVFEDNKNISKIHCTFYYKEICNKWVIKDGGDKKSLNGTYIMPRHSFEIKDGCEIKTLSNSKFKIKFIYKTQNPEMEHFEKISIYNDNASSEMY